MAALWKRPKVHKGKMAECGQCNKVERRHATDFGRAMRIKALEDGMRQLRAAFQKKRTQ